MFDIFSYFTEDTVTYATHGIIMYVFDESRADEFIHAALDDYRKAYIADEDLDVIVAGMETSRKKEIENIIPTKAIIKSGEFAEILSYLLFLAKNPEYNIAPLRWRWKEERDRAVHFADILLLSCPDETHPSATDKLMTVEVKSRATKPASDESSINNAIVGALNDSVSREGKTLSFLRQRYTRDKQFDMAKKVLRFENAVAHPYQTQHNAIAIVDSTYMKDYHIGNLDAKLIAKISDFNKEQQENNRSMVVFVIPMDDLKTKYEHLYQELPNS